MGRFPGGTPHRNEIVNLVKISNAGSLRGCPRRVNGIGKKSEAGDLFREIADLVSVGSPGVLCPGAGAKFVGRIDVGRVATSAAAPARRAARWRPRSCDSRARATPPAPRSRSGTVGG